MAATAAHMESNELKKQFFLFMQSKKSKDSDNEATQLKLKADELELAREEAKLDRQEREREREVRQHCEREQRKLRELELKPEHERKMQELEQRKADRQKYDRTVDLIMKKALNKDECVNHIAKRM